MVASVMAKQKPKKYAFFVRIDPDLARKVVDKARADRRSMTTTLEIILEGYFQAEKFEYSVNSAPKTKLPS
jgi:hypothetical protein